MNAAEKQQQETQNQHNDCELSLVACPTSRMDSPDNFSSVVGRYNAKYLAGQALSLAESLSPSYMQVYVNSLESFSTLKDLSPKKKR